MSFTSSDRKYEGDPVEVSDEAALYGRFTAHCGTFIFIVEMLMPSKDKNPTVYSTDPDPEPAKPKTPELPKNPAAPFAIQGKQPVQVRLERKGRGGKVVSIIEGVLSPAIGKEALLKYLKTKLGSGGAVKADLLEIQGDQRDRIVELLLELGYKAKKVGG
jgi:translation initiation factor 1